MRSFNIPEMVKKYTSYDMIGKHTELPEFPECRTHLLYAFLRKSATRWKLSDLMALVGSLIQMGLDTHDMVDNNKRTETEAWSEKAARTQQLRVLAGDYFSSRFYHLLAQAGQVEAIRNISETICEVNKIKTNIYMKMKQLKLTAEDYIQQTVDMKSKLFLSFSGMMDGLYFKLWPDILQGITKCEVIRDEIIRTETSDRLEQSWAYWHVMQHGSEEDCEVLRSGEDTAKIQAVLSKHNVGPLLYQMMETQMQLVWNKIQQFDSENWIQELYQIAEPLTRFQSNLQAVKEI